MTRLTQTFSALADPTRLAVVEQLMRDGELPVAALEPKSGISAPALSRHLKVLRAAGLIQQRAQGTQRLYSVRPEALRGIANWTLDHRAFWEAGLDRLDAMLAGSTGADGSEDRS